MRLSASLILLSLALASSACEVRTNRAVVYDEVIPAAGLSADRAYALRLVLFQFGGDVGGMVEWYGIDGDINTSRSPYFERDHCEYFGEGPLRGDEFRVDTIGPSGERLLLQVEADGRRALSGVVVEGGGLYFEPGAAAPISWAETDSPPPRSCLP